MKKGIEPRYKHLTPFKRCVLQNFPFIEADFDALTNYGLLCKVVKYLNDVINSQNEVQTNMEILNKAFIELKSYVDNYFEKLDVQEEINNKLDEMAESGTLTEIIAQFLGLGALAVFDNEADMIAAEQLIKGSKVQTLGKISKNDGYGAYYTIDETGDIALDNGLFATLVPDFGGNNYIDEIKLTTKRAYDSDFYILEIPKFDSDGNIINPYVGYESGSSPLTYADKNYTTVSINASCTVRTQTLTDYTMPILIGNGVILHNTNELIEAGDVADNYTYLGLTSDRTVKEYKMNNTTAQMMLDAGCVQVFNAYFKLLEHGVATDLSNVETPGGDASLAIDKHPRQVFATKSDGTIYIYTNDGRDGHNDGLTGTQIQQFLISEGIYDAWELDGGGSTSTIFKGSKLNRNVDENHTAERKIPYTLNFKKTTINEELAKAYSFIGEQKQMLNKQIMDSVVQNLTQETVSDLNNYDGAITFGFASSVSNKPTDASGYVLAIPHANSKRTKDYAEQLFFTRDTNHIYKRNKNHGNWTEWAPISDVTELIWQGSSQTLADAAETFLTVSDKVGNTYTDFITLVNETSSGSGKFQGYKFNKTGWYKFDINLEITPSTDGNVALLGKKNAGTTASSQITQYCAASKRTNINVCYISECTALADVYSIKITGHARDGIHRVRINITQLNQ